ncbi:ABC-F family ATP-binding cassette domain-containing protein [Tautonia plasticadhaerens]|uniref:Putative ABC transporter ATP-binding protein n=1 Tax=Tautonia plasticadhaerens TaxID=2527974 RepID=A0A518H4N0_9BACT|nr:ABC-F family ATP-binding cassette domain-containing protein [Tautonia plasticadhaerens]QDV35788.1 putative ABC transporter ATP-binding protein [Tautonia plasticadhaerens]
MILASATGLGRQYTGDPIFTDLAFEIRAGERIGLVGPNGAGKTTLMRLLAGIDEPDMGRLTIRPGVRVSLLRQQPDFEPGQTLFEVARSGLASLLELQDELEEAAREMAEAEDDDDRDRASRRYADLQDRLEHQDAYAIEHRVEEVVTGLGFKPGEFHRPSGTFSGGQQSRLMLARLLLESPDLMLLDEPTNHLDVATVTWLEGYLSRQPTGMVIVSHDRYFLDATVTKIWELFQGHVASYPGNYSQYWKLREERAKVLERKAEKQQEQAAHLQKFIDKFSAGTRATQAKDKAKKLEKLMSEDIELMRDISGPPMGFEEVRRSGDIVVEAKDLSKSYDTPLFTRLNLQVQRGQCVGIMGPNGAGKSTLIKTLIGRVKPDEGEVKLGHKVTVGYYDQGLESLPADTPVLKAVWPDDDPSWLMQDVRDLLGKFGLSGDLALQTVGKLSGGEKGKAALARLAATGANLLVMDEPTNHLDIWSCDALERSVREFEGTVLVVSHDRYFLNQVADRLIVVDGGRARVVEGDYEVYRRMVDQESASKERAKGGRDGGAVADGSPPPKPAADGKAKKKKKYPFRKAGEIEREIAQVEAEMGELEHALGLSETWKDADLARRSQERYDELAGAIKALYEHWEEALEYNA